MARLRPCKVRKSSFLKPLLKFLFSPVNIRRTESIANLCRRKLRENLSHPFCICTRDVFSNPVCMHDREEPTQIEEIEKWRTLGYTKVHVIKRNLRDELRVAVSLQVVL